MKKKKQKKKDVKIGKIFPVRQKVEMVAKDIVARENLRMQDIMACGRADLVGESVVIRTLEEMGGKITCPDCNSATKKVRKKTEYRCVNVKCKEVWTVTFLPVDGKEPSTPGPVHWQN